MNPRQLFDRAKSLWPDAMLLSANAEWEGGKAIWSVVQFYDAIEPQVEDDDWLSLAAWSFNQALTALARSQIALGQSILHPSEVSFEVFDCCMRKNLADESWADIRNDYDSSNL